MTYALVTDNTIRSIGPLPKVAQRLVDGTWRKLVDDTTEQQRCGYFEVVDTPRPDDTATTTHVYSVELVDGTPTVVWAPRPKTQAELDAEAEAAEHQERTFVLTQAIPTLRQWATDAEATTATSGNAISVLNVVIDRLGVFFDHFADLLENQYGDQ